jgi:uncharacterized protein
MNNSLSALYDGVVVHRRLRPIRHELRYRVFSLLVDCAEIPALSSKLRLLSYNRFNLFSLHDSDHGDGTPLSDYLARIAQASACEGVERFMMLTYPRVLGYVFNPITVYFGLDRAGETRLLVYEVNNTFGDRKTYVIPAGTDTGGSIDQSCRKELFVSPFNSVEGRYDFHLTPIGETLAVTVSLSGGEGRVMTAYFSGRRMELSDATLLRSLARTGWMTVKVIAAIHFEALKLWLKGLRLVKRPPPPAAPITYVANVDR